ncbi:membrane protein [Pokkaliibacter plantistimulans]|uniref:Membrane protein n=1 Tax=Pokkaliibacter plantistimulans TaxID=1635171 RepID=A0ABX5LSU7_9GAMM|nr:DMT family transporter [Pokkaliibacter plantistimulans]PXF29740.1 membrane protein [Pokkaliibacter plantistimulans]
MRTQDLGELLMLAALWGASFLFMRIAVPAFGPIALVAVRLGIASVFLVGILIFTGKLRKLGDHPGKLAIVGVLNTALPFVLLSYATLSMTAGFTSILNATTPLWGALIAFVWVKERLTLAQVLGLLIGFVGVITLVWGKVSFSGNGTGPAIVAALLATCSYGVAASYTRKYLSGIDPLVIATGSQLAGFILLTPLAALYLPQHSIGLSSWLSVLVLGIACTGVAYILFFRLVSRIGPSKTITVTFLIPVFGMLWGYLFLQEAVSAQMLAGAAVILAGTLLSTGLIKPSWCNKPS